MPTHCPSPLPRTRLPLAAEIKIGSSQEPDDLTFANNALVASRFRSLIEDELPAVMRKRTCTRRMPGYVPTLENGGARFLGLGEDRYLQVKYKIRPWHQVV